VDRIKIFFNEKDWKINGEAVKLAVEKQ